MATDQTDYHATEELHRVGHRYQHGKVARAHVDSVHQHDQNWTEPGSD